MSTGGNKYRVLIDSSRGPMLVEFGNCFGSHFELASEYPETLALLRNFTLTKYEELKVHAHIDRSFVSAISGSARLKQRFAMAQTKQVGSTRTEGISNAKTNNTHLVEGHEGIGVGRTSPKRCRPVSAGPYRSKPHEAIARRIHTSRSAYPSPTSEAYHSHGSVLESKAPVHVESARTDRDSEKRELCPETDELSSDAVPFQAKPRRVVRVPQKNELARPYCAQHRFVKMRKEEKSLANGYYSVVNDAPYTSAYEQEAVAKQVRTLEHVRVELSGRSITDVCIEMM